MRVNELTEATSYADAVRVFQTITGTDPRPLTKKALRGEFMKAVKRLHPDAGGTDEELFKLLSDAHDVLKLRSGRAGSSGTSGRSQSAPSETPRWAWAGHSGGIAPNSTIRTEDYRDLNFIKKTMWEMSGQSREEWTLWGFDGSFFRHTLTVYGSREIFGEMGRAMETWQTKGANNYPCRAVFASNRSEPNRLYLILLDGRTVQPSVALEHDSFNANPSNDQSFTRRLPDLLDQIASERSL